MKVKVYNQEAKIIDDIELEKEIFEVPLNSDLVHQVVVSQLWNRKQKTAKTKDRGEKRGGGRKPWRQKGTGRARHGSTRSPIWRGGGVTFGPRIEKVLKRTIPLKMKRKALFMVLSQKAKNEMILVLDEIKMTEIKTKTMFDSLNKLFLKKGSGLILLPNNDQKIVKSIRNIPKVNIMQAGDINALDLLQDKYLIIPKESIKIIEKIFLKKEKIEDNIVKPKSKS
ncbi:MAG: 50S ribosomal protein L4 [Candidatus Nealsonbacteria bacterium]